MTEDEVKYFNEQFSVLAEEFNTNIEKCAKMSPDDFVKYIRKKIEKKVNGK